MRKYEKFIGAASGFFLLAGLVKYYVTGLLDTTSTILLSLGLISIVLYVFLNWQTIKTLLSSRSAKFGTNAIITTIIVFAILVLINFIAEQHNLRIDTTAAKTFSLSDQTKKIVKSLDKELRFLAFYKSDTETQAEDLLVEYKNLSPLIKYEFIDPDKKPGIAKNYGIETYGTIVVEYGDNSEKVTTATEENLTNAIIKVTRKTKKKIYFLTGHGEKDIDDTEPTGFSVARDAIKDENYEVEKLFLADKKEIPEDCAVLVIAGPQNDLLDNEKEMIQKYLEKGGKALFLLDPAPSPGLADMLDKWGIKVGDDLVVDASGIGRLFGAGPEMPVVVNYEDHEITKGFENFMTVYPLVRSITPKEKPGEGIDVQVLAKTQPHSWSEKKPGNKVKFDEGEDTLGPISIAAVATKEIETTNGTNNNNSSTKKARLVVFGDSDFAANRFFKFQANGDLFMNAISWLAEEEDLVSIRPKSPEDRRLFLSETQSKIILIFGVVLLPLSVLAAAVAVYKQRK